MTSTRGAPSRASISMPLSVSLATRIRLDDALALQSGLRVLARFDLDQLDDAFGGALAVRVLVVVAAKEFVGELGQRVLVAVHRIELVHGVLERAADLDRLVRAGLDAEGAVHADPEVDLVALLVERAVGVRRGLDEDAAVGAGLGAGAAARATLVEPEQVGAGAGRDRPRDLRELDGCRRLDQ